MQLIVSLIVYFMLVSLAMTANEALPPTELISDDVPPNFPYELPIRMYGKVVKGHGRGSKELGFPTANLDRDAIERLPKRLSNGIYYGLAQLNDATETPLMVLSIGHNPFYGNETKSIEAHILHHFDDDFYGRTLKLMILGYIREERNFNSTQGLIEAITNDIEVCKMRMKDPLKLQFRNDKFFLY